jgi:hypothetical protein
MHIRQRRSLIQLIRVQYDAEKKRGTNSIVGSIRIDEPVLSEDLRSKLTAAEVLQFESWVETNLELDAMREALAAADLAKNLELAQAWFSKHATEPRARELAFLTLGPLRGLRKQFKKAGFLLDQP